MPIDRIDGMYVSPRDADRSISEETSRSRDARMRVENTGQTGFPGLFALEQISPDRAAQRGSYPAYGGYVGSRSLQEIFERRPDTGYYCGERSSSTRQTIGIPMGANVTDNKGKQFELRDERDGYSISLVKPDIAGNCRVTSG